MRQNLSERAILRHGRHIPTFSQLAFVAWNEAMCVCR